MAMVQSIRGMAGKRVGGGSFEVPPGLYELVVTGAVQCVSKAGKQQVELTWDVAEGPYAKTFGGSQYPPREYVGLEDNVEWSAHKMHCIAASNPGIDVEALWEQAVTNPGAWLRLIGMRFGATVTVERGIKRSGEHAGEPSSNNKIVQWFSVDEIRRGRWAETAADGSVVEHEITVPAEKIGDDYRAWLASSQQAPMAQQAPAYAPQAQAYQPQQPAYRSQAPAAQAYQPQAYAPQSYQPQAPAWQAPQMADSDIPF